jgi:parallel beta-helix repeat protein
MAAMAMSPLIAAHAIRRGRVATIKVGARSGIGVAVVAMIVGISTASSGAAGSSQIIDVRPGPNAITKAIKAAHAGDILSIHAGAYHEALTVDKPLTLRAAPGDRPTVDAACKANDAIHVTSAGVTIEGLTVSGAATGFGDYPAEIFFEGTRDGTAMNNRVIDTCDAQYGVSAFNTGPMVVAHNFARGFDDSGIYIGSISNTHGRILRVSENKTVRNARGVIVEDSNTPSVHLTVDHNVMDHNTLPNDEGLPSDGLYLTNSDHVKVLGNRANDNGANGYHPNSSSDHNVFIRNAAKGNGDRALFDEGRRNCGQGNSFSIPSC